MGAPLDREACLRYQELLTPRIFNGYGTTEAFWNTFLRPGDLPEHAGSAGRACTDDDVAVVGSTRTAAPIADDHAAKDGSEIGEVVVRSVKSGYAYVNQPEEQAAALPRRLAVHRRPRDMGRGRVRDDRRPQGRHDHLRRRERAPDPGRGGPLRAPGRGRLRRGRGPDERWGELVVAYVVAPTRPLDAAALEAHCHGHPMLAAFKRPRAYRFVDALPMTATGKKLHYQVREMAAGDAADGLLVSTVSGNGRARDPSSPGSGRITPLAHERARRPGGAGRGPLGHPRDRELRRVQSARPDRRRGPGLRSRSAARAQALAPHGALLAAGGRRGARGGGRRRDRRRRRSRQGGGACVNSAVAAAGDRAQRRAAARAARAGRPVLGPVDDPRTCRPARSRSTSASTARSTRARWPAPAAPPRCSRRAG